MKEMILNVLLLKDVDDSDNLDIKKVTDFVKSLKPKSKGKELEVRDYQTQCNTICIK